MLFVIVISIIATVIIGSVFLTSRYTIKKGSKRREIVDALNIAEAGKEKILACLRNRDLRPRPGQTDSTVYSNHPFSNGSYTVSYSTNARNDTITIISIGKTDEDSAVIKVIALLTTFNWKGWIKGAVTSPNEISSLGNIVIDGRDHDTTGALDALSPFSTYGVSSGGTVSAGGSSLMGGGTTPPQDTAVDGLNVEMNADTTGFPRTPEEVLGLPPGTLDSLASSTCPTPPFSGITYVTKGCNDYTGSGVLICHNTDGDASLGNFHAYDTFKGLIIADENSHFNDSGFVIGAVIMLGREVGGNTFGNGDLKILYSSLMIEQAIKEAYDEINRRWAIPVVSWRQIR